LGDFILSKSFCVDFKVSNFFKEMAREVQ
jgi:hypothetical protein